MTFDDAFATKAPKSSSDGKALSHAAIVAREYGIPAVMACGNATAKLHDGDFVVVDGANATVTIA